MEGLQGHMPPNHLPCLGFPIPRVIRNASHVSSPCFSGWLEEP